MTAKRSHANVATVEVGHIENPSMIGQLALDARRMRDGYDGVSAAAYSVWHSTYLQLVRCMRLKSAANAAERTDFDPSEPVWVMAGVRFNTLRDAVSYYRVSESFAGPAMAIFRSTRHGEMVVHSAQDILRHTDGQVCNAPVTTEVLAELQAEGK